VSNRKKKGYSWLLYGLPKIHKITYPNPYFNINTNIQFRPIVDASDAFFTNTSKFLNSYFSKFIKENQFIITNTSTLIYEIESINCPLGYNLIIISGDVNSLLICPWMELTNVNPRNFRLFNYIINSKDSRKSDKFQLLNQVYPGKPASFYKGVMLKWF
jgi:hypothetical protein